MVLILKRHLPTLLVLGLTFLAGFSVYLLTLAPTVTFEDSGELITAAYHLGIPHQPGYPLFTLLGRTFSLLPLQNVAYRLNLMSAFLTALGAMFICWAVILFIDDNMKGNSRQAVSRTSEFFFKYAPAFGAGMMMISTFEIWEQSLITEVYGLNNLFVSLFIFILILWHRQRDLSEKVRYFFIASYLSGLAFSNHTTSLMFLPIMVVFIILWDRRIILNAGSIAGGLVFFALGVTPYIYLPVASARNPWMDWGNPENWTNFIRTVSRHQYGLEGGPSLEEYLPQLVTYGELILQQWVISLFFAGFFLAGFALYKMFKERNPLFYIFIFFFILAAPLTTYLTNFDVTVADVFVASENKALVSVFYIPSYILIAFLAGIGVFKIFQYLNLKTSLMYATAIIFLLIILVSLFNNYSHLI